MKNMEPEYDLDLSFGFEHMDQEYQKEMFELDKNEINDNVEYFNQSVVDDHSLTIEQKYQKISTNMKKLEDLIGYQFNDIGLLIEAMTVK